MKKIIASLAAFMLIICGLFTLASCNNDSGYFTNGNVKKVCDKEFAEDSSYLFFHGWYFYKGNNDGSSYNFKGLADGWYHDDGDKSSHLDVLSATASNSSACKRACSNTYPGN